MQCLHEMLSSFRNAGADGICKLHRYCKKAEFFSRRLKRNRLNMAERSMRIQCTTSLLLVTCLGCQRRSHRDCKFSSQASRFLHLVTWALYRLVSKKASYPVKLVHGHPMKYNSKKSRAGVSISVQLTARAHLCHL